MLLGDALCVVKVTTWSVTNPHGEVVLGSRFDEPYLHSAFVAACVFFLNSSEKSTSLKKVHG